MFVDTCTLIPLSEGGWGRLLLGGGEGGMGGGEGIRNLKVSKLFLHVYLYSLDIPEEYNNIHDVQNS